MGRPSKQAGVVKTVWSILASKPHVTNQEIAEDVGVHTRTIVRLIASLKSAGAIQVEYHHHRWKGNWVNRRTVRLVPGSDHKLQKIADKTSRDSSKLLELLPNRTDVSNKVLANELGCSKATVARRLRKLRDEGRITSKIVRAPRNGKGTSRTITVNGDPSRDRDIEKFTASVLKDVKKLYERDGIEEQLSQRVAETWLQLTPKQVRFVRKDDDERTWTERLLSTTKLPDPHEVMAYQKMRRR